MTTIRGIDQTLDTIGESTGAYAKIREQAALGARNAVRTPLIAVGVLAATGLVVATIALVRRR